MLTVGRRELRKLRFGLHDTVSGDETAKAVDGAFGHPRLRFSSILISEDVVLMA